MIFQSFRMAWKAILSNKMRSFLTMLGIIIGVLSLIVLVSIANGATSSVSDSISSMGTNLMTVTIKDNKENPLKLTDLTEIQGLSTVAWTAPLAQTSLTGKNGHNEGTLTVYGTTGGYASIQNLTLAAGRFIKQSDVDNHTNVVVLNEYAVSKLIGSRYVDGQKITIGGNQFTVIGMLKSDDNTTGYSDDQLEVYIPYSTLTRLESIGTEISSFYVSAKSEDSMDGAKAEVTSWLLNRLSNDSDAFQIVTQSEMMETMSSVTNTMSLMLGGIAAISLLVGGIGIMNIMLVSVTERTREIGIRKAIGAEPGGIMLQFVIEALLISMMGCFTGILLSALALKILSLFMSSMTLTISGKVVGIAAGFSGAIGLIFGFYPAWKAARKKPIDALRYSG